MFSRTGLDSVFLEDPYLPSRERLCSGDADDPARGILGDSLDRSLRSGERFDFLVNAVLDLLSPSLLRIGEDSSVNLLLRDVCETGEAGGLGTRAVLLFRGSARTVVLCVFSCSGEDLLCIPFGSGEELYLFLLGSNFLSVFLDEPLSDEGDLLDLDLDTDLWDPLLDETFFWTGETDRDEDFLLEEDRGLSLGESNLFCVILEDCCLGGDRERDLFFPYNCGLRLRDLEAIEETEGDLLF